ncbi:MAG: molybdopterin oxidoreductase, partial [Polyangiales bacterium]
MWRTLEDKNTDPDELKRLAEEEKPGGFVTDLLSPKTLVSRRSFVQGSSIAALAAGLQGCLRRPENEILPYSKAPEYLVPGIASHFATVTARGRDALGVVVTSHDGRPTKVEGNEQHTRSFGGTDVRAQAYVWDLYDPDRSQSPAQRRGNALVNSTDAAFDEALKGLVKKHEGDEGAGLRFLAPISNSPTFRRMRGQVLAKFPKAKFYTYSSIDDDNVREGARIAFGTTVYPAYDYAQSMVTVSLGADFLGNEPGSTVAGRQFVVPRGITKPSSPMARLYVAESSYSVTGGMADHRLRIPSRDIERFTRLLVVELAGRGIEGLMPLGDLIGKLKGGVDVEGIDLAFLGAVADDLVANRGKSIVVAGGAQPPIVHALTFAINQALGNAQKTAYISPVIDSEDISSREGIAALVAEQESISTLFILAGNPIYNAPADVKLAEMLGREGLTSVHLSSHRDETSESCSWHVPMAHELESWGDQQALDGSVAVQQPLIAPLYGGRSAIELLAAIAGEKETKSYDLVRGTHKAAIDKTTTALLLYGFNPQGLSQAQIWRAGLHNGVLLKAQAGEGRVNEGAIGDALASSAGAAETASKLGAGNFEVTFEPDPALWDGTHANNLWALELPNPMTKLVWDNAALLSPGTAKALGARNGQMLRLSKGEGRVEVPAWIVPGHADNSITLT